MRDTQQYVRYHHESLEQPGWYQAFRAAGVPVGDPQARRVEPFRGPRSHHTTDAIHFCGAQSLVAMSLPRVIIRRHKHAVAFGWRASSPRPLRPHEDKYDASVRTAPECVHVAQTLSRFGPVPGDGSGRPAAHAGGCGPRVRCSIRASSWPPADRERPGRPRRPTWPTALRRPLQPYFAEDQFPGISVAVVTDGKVAMAQGYGTATWRTARPSKPTPDLTSVR